jgi:hypothetical protein
MEAKHTPTPLWGVQGWWPVRYADVTRIPRRTLQRELQQAVAKRVLLASGATHWKRYRLDDEIV